MEVDNGEVAPKEYDYLLSMPLWSLSKEKIEEEFKQMKIDEKEAKKQAKLEVVR